MAQKVYFFKREAIGKPNEYTTTIYKPVPKGDDMVWQEINKLPPSTYDERYFGCYKSHTDDTTNKETFNDEHASIWRNPMFCKWLPLYAVFAIGAFAFIYDIQIRP